MRAADISVGQKLNLNIDQLQGSFHKFTWKNLLNLEKINFFSELYGMKLGGRPFKAMRACEIKLNLMGMRCVTQKEFGAGV